MTPPPLHYIKTSPPPPRPSVVIDEPLVQTDHKPTPRISSEGLSKFCTISNQIIPLLLALPGFQSSQF
ncbi:hypothetical protein K443DRAFT_380388 [Laccaria amethystina LaAM-08-1]|uniref:Uncharacterized protein n=1 Tax=Laccaria amethystina LaAM-08-1 TaxID=1095629 RepID=A0A0C9X810_9AGAR|nr:hypothetical protein K443DRAFT_380388 [Laccaria amethystina LaAM-08-1]